VPKLGSRDPSDVQRASAMSMPGAHGIGGMTGEHDLAVRLDGNAAQPGSGDLAVGAERLVEMRVHRQRHAFDGDIGDVRIGGDAVAILPTVQVWSGSTGVPAR